MSLSTDIVPLSDEIDRSRFDCGVEALNRYFASQVTQDMRRRACGCYVALDRVSRDLAGYYTLSATSLPLSEIAPATAKKMLRYPLAPAGHVGRLAVAKNFRSQGIGSKLLVDAIVRARNSELVAYALVVDAEDEPAVRFYQHHGFLPFASNPISLYLSLATAADRLGR